LWRRESGKTDTASQLEKTVCAFSNQKGGTLFIGVSKEGRALIDTFASPD
jgi:predicted HTH transcriptional regulator